MKLPHKIIITILSFAVPGTAALISFLLITPIKSWSLVLILVFAALMAYGSISMWWLFHREVARPIKVLSDAVTRVRLGDLSQAIPVTSEDEIGLLSRNFNDMTLQLATTNRTLQAATKVAEERQAELESSINSLRQGFVLMNATGKMILSNTAIRDLVRSGQDNSPSDHKKNLTVEEISQVLPNNFNFEATVMETLKQCMPAKYGGLAIGGRFVNLFFSPVQQGGEVIGCAVLLEDITEERILQRSRDEFFSIASHELRTPLTAIRGNAQMISQFYPEVLRNDGVKDMLDDIRNSAIRLIEIVNDFLDVSRIEQDKITFNMRPVTIDQVVESVIYEMTSLSREKHIALHFDHHTLGKLPPVYADEDRVKQILYNLVGNAMRVTEHGSVTINCLEQGKLLKVCVTDTGPGISSEAQQLLFHKFQQTSQNILTRDSSRGTGLGLYICKLLCEHMGGHIKLEHSELGKGSTFSFTLPFATTKQQAKLTPGS